MKCPDCGSRLSDIQIDGKFLYRCFHCGGFWADAHTFSEIDPHALVAMRRVKIDSLWLKGGTGVCPQDGMMLQRYVGEDVPVTIEVRYCVRCGKRWYGGDGLFVQKISDGAVGSKPASAPRVLFLSFVAVFLLGGLWVSMKLASRSQNTQVGAQSEIFSISVLPIDSRSVLVTVVSRQKVDLVEYKSVGASEWQQLPMTGVGDNGYIGKILDLTKGNYMVRVGDKIQEFAI